jgi:hypothetical protein
MDLESIYIELPDEAKDYYCSLRKSISKNILNIVSDKYEFKLKKLIEKENKIHDDYNEKKNFNSSKNKRKSLLDQWVSNNPSSRNTIQYKENIKELGELYFELRDFKRINEDAYNESIKLLGEEKEKIERSKLHHLKYLLRENWKIDKKTENDKKLKKIYDEQKKEQERIEIKELEQERLEIEKLEQERLAELSKIKNDAIKRGIENLVHFTTLNYLDQLLNEGIFSRDKLRKDKINSQNYIYTDKDDFADNAEWISTSISFPNYKMFITKRDNIDNLENLKDVKGWVVIALDSKILWELNCRFTHVNAAKYRYFTAPTYSKHEKFHLMFEKTILRSPALPDKYTTNVQAEVLVKDYIATKYIKEIIFEDTKTANDFQNSTNTNYKITVDRRYFRWREDHSYQKNLING